ncbi:MAG: phasin family protein [Pseudomonadales bacterium]|nr:phasin family protein [Pseudomonadales bacterium]
MSDDKQNENDDVEKDRVSPLKALSGASRDIRKYTHQIWLAGLGAFARAEEEGSGFFDALVEAGREVERQTKDKTESRVEEIKERVRHHTGETMEKMEKAFDDRLNKALSRLGLPNKREVEELERRVHELTKALDEAEDEVTGSDTAPKRPSRKKR